MPPLRPDRRDGAAEEPARGDGRDGSERARPRGAIQRPAPERQFVVRLVALALALGILYALITPPGYGNDEEFHFVYTQSLWESGGAKIVGASPTRMSTYYWLTAGAYALTSGEQKQVQYFAMRLVSLALFVAEVVFAYLIARMLSPSSRFVYLATPALVALLPGRLWTAATLNDDNLAAPASAALLYFALRCLLRELQWRSVGGLALLVALTLLSKRTAWPVVAVVGIALLVALVGRIWAGRRPSVRRIAAALSIVAGVLAATLVLFGDRLARAVAVSANPGRLARLSQIPEPQPDPFVFQFKTFWLPLWRDDYGPPDLAYRLALGLCLAAAVGLALHIASAPLRRRGAPVGRRGLLCVGILVAAVAGVWLLSLVQYLTYVGGTESFIPSDRKTGWAMHARYIFPALVPMAYLMAVGLARLIPARAGSLGLSVLVALLLFLDGVAVYSLVSMGYWWTS